MLPNISLDNDRYKEILESARSMIASLYPEWTDFNYHDPGITLLELFSWIKESQQYYIDQIGKESRKKYLKLLGLQPWTKAPARAEVEIAAQEDLCILKGTKFYADETCFEAEEHTYILKNDISRCICFDGGQSRIINQSQLNLGSKLQFLPFGREPQEGSCFYLGFDAALPANKVLRALIDIFDDHKIKRNPVEDPEAFYPLAEFVVEVNTKNGWQAVTLVSDETHAFLFSGNIKIFLECEMEPCEVEGIEAYYLRICLTKCGYDLPPMVQAISFNSVAVCQKDTLSEIIDFPPAGDGKYRAATELSITGTSLLYAKVGKDFYLIPTVTRRIDQDNNCAVFEVDLKKVHKEAEGLRLVNTTSSFANSNIAGYGTGLPFQELDLNHKNIEYDSFAIMTEDPELTDHYFPWVKVDDFSASAPSDRHYLLDSAAGIVKFGDCKKGMAPEGTIILTGLANTLGSNGNVKQNTINRIGPGDIPGLKIINKANAVGGRDEETLDECFKRARRILKKPRSAVTYGDYENYVLKTPGLMLESCKVVPAGLNKRQVNAVPDMNVNIVVKPFYPEQAAIINEAYVRNIKNHLERFRLLGTNIGLVAPEYIAVTVYGDITVKPHYLNARSMVDEAIKKFFYRYKDLFGAEIIYSELYGVVDRQECVSNVSSLSMEAKGSGISRTKEGNIILPANGVVVLSDIQLMFSVEP